MFAPAVAPACAPPSPRARFESDVAPVLETRCLGASCHGIAQDAEARGETTNWTHFYVRTTSDGLVADMDAAYAASKARIDTLENPDFSSLLRKPLAVERGRGGHVGLVQFFSRDDPAYRSIRDWIASESGGGEGGRFEGLPPLEQRFATDVLPSLVTRQCLNGGCHGTASPFVGFDFPVPLDDGTLGYPFAGLSRLLDAETRWPLAPRLCDDHGQRASFRIVGSES